MKLRVTKRRIAVAVLMLPVLYALNVGPMIFCVVRFGFPPQPVLIAMYSPLADAAIGTPFEKIYFKYISWWQDFSSKGAAL